MVDKRKIHILDRGGWRLLCSDNPALWDKSRSVCFRLAHRHEKELCLRCKRKMAAEKDSAK